MKNYMLSIKNWIKKNPVEFYVLLAILVVGAFCRLYKIDAYMTFLGDEGRDVITVRRLLVEGHPPLIGPGTSIGNMYLGPLYYYFMAPALLVANFSPVGPAIEIAILGIITIVFVWWVGREWFGKVAGVTSAALYAVAPTIIVYSRSSWNPNIMPFFSLLTIYSVWRVWKFNQFKWLLVTGFAFAFVLQSHYLGLLLVPTIFIFWLFVLLRVWKERQQRINLIRYSIFASIIFLLLMSPLLFFDIRHNWINSRAIYKFFTERQATVSIKPWNAIPVIPVIFAQISDSLISAKNVVVGVVVSVILAVFVGILFIFRKRYLQNTNYYLLFLWLAFALIGLGLYKQQIYDHYFGFIFAAMFILLGACFQFLSSYKRVIPFLGVVFAGLIGVNVYNSPLKYPPNYQLKRAEDVAGKIEQEAGGREFNVAVIAERNYPDGYKYFLIKNGDKVIDIDAQVPSTITSQLFVVCEKEQSKCNPVNAPQAEVANFGWSKIENSWIVDGVTVYKLIHTK